MYSASVIVAWVISIILIEYLLKLSKWRVRRIPPLPPPREDEEEISMVIVVPFRNEERNLPLLMHDLSQQSKSCSIVFVDDHSEDQSAAIVKDRLNRFVDARLLNAQGEGKKAALRTALNATKSTYIITLDADVRLSERWFEELQDFLMLVRPVLAILPLRLANDHSVLGALQAAEWNMLAGLTAGSAMAGEAILCNGAHLAFHRDVVAEMLPNERSVSSGDDMFLLEKAKRMGPVYYYSSDAVKVTTSGVSSWSGFFAQRVRWAGKSRRLRDRDILGFALRTFIIQGFQLLLPLYLWWNPEMIWFVFAWLYVKWSAELGVPYNYCRVVNIRWSFISSLVVVMVYPLYSILVAMIGMVYRPTWKGRKIKQ